MSAERFPCPQGMSSFWHSWLGQLDDHRTTDSLPQQVDVLIIGPGYSSGVLLTHMLSLNGSKENIFLVIEARQLLVDGVGSRTLMHPRERETIKEALDACITDQPREPRHKPPRHKIIQPKEW